MKVAVLGLDCLSPELVFDRWQQELPALNSLMRGGAYGRLRSCIPPITVPAWSCMLSSKDPGQLGIYGFRNRTDYSYDGLAVATSHSVREPRIWDLLDRHGGRSILIGVPGTYPPPTINGLVVADFLTPSKASQYTWPADLKTRVDAVVPDYRFDVTDFRTENKQHILDQLFSMTTDRFKLGRELASSEAWDFFMLHEIGPDRIHHGFWATTDPEHRRFEADNPYQNCIFEYYQHLDKEVGQFLEALSEDTAVLIASDHGAKAMAGGICINEWLARRGYMALKSPLEGPTPLAKADIDWSHTLAWGEGGYYARVFFNIRGREPEGALDPVDYDAFADQLAAELGALPDDQGRPMDTQVYRPKDIYADVRGIAPDLTVLFDDLAWRSVGMLGTGGVYTFENDTGPDDANHSMDGVIILSEPGSGQGGRQLEEATLYDVAPTVLELLGLRPPGDMIGRSLAAA